MSQWPNYLLADNYFEKENKKAGNGQLTFCDVTSVMNNNLLWMHNSQFLTSLTISRTNKMSRGRVGTHGRRYKHLLENWWRRSRFYFIFVLPVLPHKNSFLNKCTDGDSQLELIQLVPVVDVIKLFLEEISISPKLRNGKKFVIMSKLALKCVNNAILSKYTL